MTTLSPMLLYIQGQKFADLIPFEIEQSEPLQDRMDVVENLIKGRTVLHIGCLDHLPLIAAKIKEGRWFHGRLSNAASECLGVDVNNEGIHFVESELGIHNVCYSDITSSDKNTRITAGHWNYVVFGEILEHVDNPVDFLQRFLQNYGQHIDKIIITVPNAFRIGNILATFKGKEVINSDHRYWFSPYTIWKVVHQAGFQAEHIKMCKFSSDRSGIQGFIKRTLLQKYPLLAEDIIIVAQSSTN